MFIFLKNIKGITMKHILIAFVLTSSVFAMEPGSQKWDGDYYQKNSSPQFKSAVELLRTLDLSKCQTIVDIGCGSGEVTDAITQMAPHARVVGIDASESMIKKAKESHAANSRLSFEVVDAQDESHTFFKEPRFDLAFSSAALLWMANKQAVFNNIHRMLNTNGRVVAKTTQPLPQQHPLILTLGALARTKWLSFVQTYQKQKQHFPMSITDAKQIIDEEKWTAVDFQDRQIVNKYDSEQELADWMKGWMGAMPAVAALSSDTQNALNKDFTSTYVTMPGTKEEGKIIYSLPGLLIQASKK